MTRALVAGGAGFIGSHLCEKLLQDGSEVVCLDNLSTGRRENVEHLNQLGAFSLIEADVQVHLDLAADEIYNLACPASPDHYMADPIGTMRTCVLGSMQLLELARRNKARVFFASTSEVYGQPGVHPQPERYRGAVDPTGVRACYDEGKRAAETLHADYSRKHGVNVRIARIFNTYGPRMRPDDGRLIPNMIRQALLGHPLTVYGSGAQTRSFCYVIDLVDGIVALMGSAAEGPVNLGNDQEIQVLDLAARILDLTGSHSSIKLLPARRDDPSRRRPDLTRAKVCLDYAPGVELDDGLTRTIDWFRRRLLTKEAA